MNGTASTETAFSNRIHAACPTMSAGNTRPTESGNATSTRNQAKAPPNAAKASH